MSNLKQSETDLDDRKVVLYDTDKKTKRKILRPGLKLIGAKTKQRAVLYRFFPKGITAMLEPFMGTAGVTIGMENIPNLAMCTDINYDAINYYDMIVNYTEDFYRVLYEELQHLYAEGYDNKERGKVYFENWKLRCDALGHPDNLTPHNKVKLAVLFYLITKHCFNGIWRRNQDGVVNSSYCQTIAGRGVFTKDWYLKVVNKSKDIIFRHMDFEESISAWSSDSNAFIFADPPYRRTKNIKDGKGCVTDYNGKRFTDEDQVALRYHLGRCKGKWLLTINDDPWIRSLYQGYYMVDRKVFYSCSQTPEGRSERPELLIANYNLIDRYEEVLKDIEHNAKRKGEILE